MHFSAGPSTHLVPNEMLTLTFIILTLPSPQDRGPQAGALPSQSRRQIRKENVDCGLDKWYNFNLHNDPLLSPHFVEESLQTHRS